MMTWLTYKNSAAIMIVTTLFMTTFFASSCFAAGVYLDVATTNCSNGSSTYDSVNRTCGSGIGKVYDNLASFSANLVAGETNYIRAGSYFRDNSTGGSLDLTAAHSGAPGKHTIVAAFPGEERLAIIGTAKRRATYNSAPGDTGWTGSADYYPNSAILITGANYVTISGLKTYGQVYSRGNHDVILENSDFGGGGPSENQGQVVKLNNVYNAIVRNNLVHNSCWGENDENGSAIIFYDASALIENNTFYDNWGYDVFLKDSGKQSGRTIEIRYNFFGPSNIFQNIGGIRGHNQDIQASAQLIHHNIFLNKHVGFTVLAAPATNNVYNNTFVNCTADIVNSSSGGPHELRTYNNIFYHPNPGKHFKQLYSQDYLMGSDYNIFFGPGIWGKSAPGAYTWETTLSGWQNFIGMDTKSIIIDPKFVNSSGSSPRDFKRTSYQENFSGSPYSNRAGAYETGNELIGFIPTGENVNVISAPKNLRIISD